MAVKGNHGESHENFSNVWENFNAEKMVEVTSEHNHLVTSFGWAFRSVYQLMDKLIEANAISQQTFSCDPRQSR